MAYSTTTAPANDFSFWRSSSWQRHFNAGNNECMILCFQEELVHWHYQILNHRVNGLSPPTHPHSSALLEMCGFWARPQRLLWFYLPLALVQQGEENRTMAQSFSLNPWHHIWFSFTLKHRLTPTALPWPIDFSVFLCLSV